MRRVFSSPRLEVMIMNSRGMGRVDFQRQSVLSIDMEGLDGPCQVNIGGIKDGGH